MAETKPSELFEPKGVDASYLMFLVDEHIQVYPGTRAILRLTHYTSAATFRMIRLLKNLYPVGLAIKGKVLWVEANPDGTYTRHMISREQYES